MPDSGYMSNSQRDLIAIVSFALALVQAVFMLRVGKNLRRSEILSQLHFVARRSIRYLTATTPVMLLAGVLAWRERAGPEESPQLIIVTALFGLQILGWMLYLFVAPDDSEVPFSAEVSLAEMMFCFGVAGAGLILRLIFAPDPRAPALEWAVLGIYGTLLQVVWLFSLLHLFGFCMHLLDAYRSSRP